VNMVVEGVPHDLPEPGEERAGGGIKLRKTLDDIDEHILNDILGITLEPERKEAPAGEREHVRPDRSWGSGHWRGRVAALDAALNPPAKSISTGDSIPQVTQKVTQLGENEAIGK